MSEYIRYWFSGKVGAYEQRLVARIAWGPRVPFPNNVDVHHNDFHEQHNCRANLIIMDRRLHRPFNKGKFGRGHSRRIGRKP